MKTKNAVKGKNHYARKATIKRKVEATTRKARKQMTADPENQPHQGEVAEPKPTKLVVVGGRGKPSSIVVKAPKVKAPRKKPKQENIMLAGRPLRVTLWNEEKFPAVLMPYRETEFSAKPGPFTQIVVKGTGAKPAPLFWVRVTKGNAQNGEGVIAKDANQGILPLGMKVRFGGGTAQTPARLFSDEEGPVESRKGAFV